ncbi:glycosyltransferase family 1 protein [Dermabacteraceae bacterium TAE3-ERU27]|nr:glycosyltransferase family 1 protein [Dermabacteraceae bacterium TAE3-ERU27]
METPLRIILIDDGGPGWAPITQAAKVLATTLEGELYRFPLNHNYSRKTKLRSTLPRIRGKRYNALLISPVPSGLYAAAEMLDRHAAQVYGWVIDSFWWDRIPRIVNPPLKTWQFFDHIYVSDGQDVSAWESRTGVSVSCLPWGADVKTALSVTEELKKNTDLTRIGRQPAAWDDDLATGEAAAKHSLAFSGRPPFGKDHDDTTALYQAYAHTKAVLAFNNLVSPANYTHHERSYLTARWTDSCAYGALTAGIPPESPTTKKLLPDWTQVRLSTTDVHGSLSELHSALSEWTPELSRKLQLHAAENLDWRRHATQVARDLGLDTTQAKDSHEAVIATARQNLIKDSTTPPQDWDG